MGGRRDGPARPGTIAIDGPVASGKTSIGKELARRLGYLFLDTGLLYRALARLALQTATPLDDGAGLAALARAADIDVLAAPEPVGYTVRAAGRDITGELQGPEVDAAASAVSAHGDVRAALLPVQRRVGRRGNVVMVGRDVGTVVLPEADLKIYLDAPAEVRARRRWLERKRLGRTEDYERVLAGVIARDARDSSRAAAPLSVAADAVVVDTGGLDFGEVLDHLLELVALWPGTP